MEKHGKYPLLNGAIIVLGDARIKTPSGGTCDICHSTAKDKHVVSVRLCNETSWAYYHLDCFDLLIEKYKEAVEEHRLRLLAG